MRTGYESHDRDRAFRRGAVWTVASVAGAAGLTGTVSAVSAVSFAAANPKVPAPPVPVIPVEKAPAQLPRPKPAVIVQVIHLPGSVEYVGGGASYNRSSGIAPPRQAPIAVPQAAPGGGQQRSAPPPPPPPPPPPVCHSTPSHPC